MFQQQHHLLLPLLWVLFLASALDLSTADVGTAAIYRPPYIRKRPGIHDGLKCYARCALPRLLSPAAGACVILAYLCVIGCAATACFGSDVSQFPPDNLFAAAGEGIWDNGASCGRQYLVRCLSSSVPRACPEGHPTIQIRIVDQASTSVSPPALGRTTMALSLAAFEAITNASAGAIWAINVEFVQ